MSLSLSLSPSLADNPRFSQAGRCYCRHDVPTTRTPTHLLSLAIQKTAAVVDPNDASSPADIKALTVSTPSLIQELGPAFEKYNEEQFTTVKLPGGTRHVIISSHSSLGDGRYYDVESSSSFDFDHATQVSTAARTHATTA